MRHQRLQAKWLANVCLATKDKAVHHAWKRANGIIWRWFCLALPAVGNFFQARTSTTLKAPERKVFTEWHEEALQEWMPMPLALGSRPDCLDLQFGLLGLWTLLGNQVSYILVAAMFPWITGSRLFGLLPFLY